MDAIRISKCASLDRSAWRWSARTAIGVALCEAESGTGARDGAGPRWFFLRDYCDKCGLPDEEILSPRIIASNQQRAGLLQSQSPQKFLQITCRSRISISRPTLTLSRPFLHTHLESSGGTKHTHITAIQCAVWEIEVPD